MYFLYVNVGCSKCFFLESMEGPCSNIFINNLSDGGGGGGGEGMSVEKDPSNDL